MSIDNDLPNGWVETTLGEISLRKQYGYTESARLEEVGPKFLRITDIQNDFISWNTVPYCPISDSDYAKYKLEIGDIVIARTGNSTGATATIKENVDAVFASYLIRFQLKKEKADYRFIDFLVRSKNWYDFVNSVKSGSAQGGANANDFASFPINLPPPKEQKAIATILTTFDDKIELLQAQNETLETIAQTIFKEWFGKYQVGDVLPEGWRVGKLGEEFDITMGQSPKGTSYNIEGSGTVFFQGRAEFTERFPEVRLYTTDPKRMADKFDVLVSVRAPVGDINVASEKCCIGRGLAAVSSSYKSYCLYKIKSLKPVFDLYESEGTVFGSINKNSFSNIEVVIPVDSYVKGLDSTLSTLDMKIYNNYLQIQTLQATRDTLLPKLMSGKVRVDEFKE